MLIKILAASALTLGLATGAVAESAGNGGAAGSGQSVTVEPRTPANSPPDQMMPDDMSLDMGTTGSIYGGPTYDGPTYDGMNSNADRNCPASPQGAQPDANNLSPGTASPSVNDNHCGK
ncbi:MAG: hypothetical protein E5V89_24585 [Mesorhizobium sp.]|uniref:hypothetical protein n=1 Tax=Mesorhizobium sp. TaxID=1871066 RepID=UPI000FE4C516|nr:hypothetical protein [Mesorhizobium sp.]RWD52327.1 MAG: hypothetical protein EOS36_29545 [Mesorhizobium sp.]RWE50747.1 MAG: hypothetical protein EOS79_04680 [Mesorhizobium sp.]TIV67215.1 MAG: hypothetical protein E5V89_24585 [Mesorhizobium sp.]